MTVSCPGCRTPLSREALTAADERRCAACEAPLTVLVFPALLRPPPQGAAGEALVEPSQASCFEHPHLSATAACDRCGRFICGLCDVQLASGHYCPTCAESGREGTILPELDVQRTRWDQVALALAVYPLLLIYVTPLTATAALVVSLRYWKKPISVVPRSRVRFVLAIALAVLELAGAVVLGFVIFAVVRSR